MTTDELRAKFEEWATVERRFNVERHPWRHGGYCYTSTDLAWEAWQAAHASRDAEVEALKRDVERYRSAIQRHKDGFPDEPLTGEAELWSELETAMREGK